MIFVKVNKVIRASELIFKGSYNFWSVEFESPFNVLIAAVTRRDLILYESHKNNWKGYVGAMCLSSCFWEVLTEEDFDVLRISVAVRLFVVSISYLFFQISPLT